jgi:hypothetical protein
VPVSGVLLQSGHEGGGDGLPADGLAFLAEPNQALVRVQVGRAERESAAAAAGGLGVQSQQQGVQFRVVAGGRGDVVDFGEAGVGDGLAGGGQAPGLVNLAGRVVGLGDVAVVLGVAVKAA